MAAASAAVGWLPGLSLRDGQQVFDGTAYTIPSASDPSDAGSWARLNAARQWAECAIVDSCDSCDSEWQLGMMCLADASHCGSRSFAEALERRFALAGARAPAEALAGTQRLRDELISALQAGTVGAFTWPGR